MKKFLISAAMGATAVVAASAAVAVPVNGVTGTVNVNGTVTAKCTVQPGGGSTFSGNIGLGPLDDSNGSGKISSTLASSTAGSPAGTASFSVICNSGAPSVSLSATSMQSNVVSPPSGYTNTVDYTAELDVGLAAGGTSNFTYPTPSGPQGGGTALSGPMSNATDNVVVKVYHLNTDGGSDSSVLTVGTFGSPGGATGSGVITINITPT